MPLTTDFVQHLKQRGLTELTMRCYQADMVQFEKFCQERGRTMLQATRDNIQEFLSSHNFSPATKRRKTATLSTFYGWCVSQGMLDSKPAKPSDLDLPKIDHRPQALSYEEQIKLFAGIQASDPFLMFRDRVLAKFCIHGMRLQNILDIDIDKMEDIWSWVKEHALDAEEDLLNYLKFRDERWPDKQGKLFLNCHGRSLSSRSVRRKINFYGGKVGVKATPRALKNTYKAALPIPPKRKGRPRKTEPVAVIEQDHTDPMPLVLTLAGETPQLI
jgi:site-specific recombinase XerD